MQVRDILKSGGAPATIEGHQTIYEAMSLMTEGKIGSLIVVDGTRAPIGIITESDIFSLAFQYRGEIMELSVAANMSSNLILGVLDDDLDFIAEVMIHKGVQHIPIMDHDQKLCGVISIRDVVRAKITKSALSSQ